MSHENRFVRRKASEVIGYYPVKRVVWISRGACPEKPRGFGVHERPETPHIFCGATGMPDGSKFLTGKLRNYAWSINFVLWGNKKGKWVMSWFGELTWT